MIDQHSIPPIVPYLALGLLICLIYIVYRKALPKPYPNIPHDEAAAQSILGSFPSMFSYTKQHGVVIPWMTNHNIKHNAPLVQFFGLPFTRPILVLSDFQEAQDVLIRRTKDFDRAERTLEVFAGILPEHHISMRTNDPRFKGNKELVRDLMSPSFLQNVSSVQIYAKSLNLIELWSKKAEIAGGRPFNAQQDVFDAAMDMVNAAAFAFDDNMGIIKRNLSSFGSINNALTPDESETDQPVEFSRVPVTPEISAMQGVVRFLGTQSVSPWPFLTYWYNMLTNTNLRSQFRMKDDVIKKQLAISGKRLEAGDKAQFSATDYLVQREYSVARKENRTPNLYSRRTIDELFGFILGGHETTATSMCWMIKFLSDNQAAQTKLRDVLKTSFANALDESRQPTSEEIATSYIPYLDATIEESLRLGSLTPLVARQAIRDTVLLGHHIPKGALLFISSAGPSFFTESSPIPESLRCETSKNKHWGGSWDMSDVHIFKPERWLKQVDGVETYDHQAGPFLTFSLGPRGCFGKKLAYLEMRLILTLLVWNFHFKKFQGELASYETKEGITVMPKHCYVAIEKI